MIVEFVGGPKDGDRLPMKDGTMDFNFPIPTRQDAAYIPPDGPCLADTVRIGRYVAEPYTWELDKKTQCVRIKRADKVILFHVHAYVFGGSELYWQAEPMLFHWQGE